MDVPQELSPPPLKIPRVETPEPTQRRGITQEPATAVPLEPAPRQRVIRKSKVTMTPGHAKRKPPYTEPHFIPDDTEVRPQLTHPYNGRTCNVPLLHIYNNRARKMKCHNLMAKHVATIPPPRPPPTSLPTHTVQLTREEWEHTNKTTGEVKIQTGQINVVISLETGKSQY